MPQRLRGQVESVLVRATRRGADWGRLVVASAAVSSQHAARCCYAASWRDHGSGGRRSGGAGLMLFDQRHTDSGGQAVTMSACFLRERVSLVGKPQRGV